MNTGIERWAQVPTLSLFHATSFPQQSNFYMHGISWVHSNQHVWWLSFLLPTSNSNQTNESSEQNKCRRWIVAAANVGHPLTGVWVFAVHSYQTSSRDFCVLQTPHFSLGIGPSPDLIRRVYRFQYNAWENGLVDIACIPQTPPGIWRIQSNCPTGNHNDVN